MRRVRALPCRACGLAIMLARLYLEQKAESMAMTTEGTVLWEPSPALQQHNTLREYMQWLGTTRGLQFDEYAALWEWSVRDLDAFWSSIWDYYQVEAATPPSAVLSERQMPGAVWFPGATLNYAQHIFRAANADHPALLIAAEGRETVEMSWAALQRSVAQLAAHLRRTGVGVGDRVVAYLPNIPEAVIGLLACASIGAVWSSCSPDFGSAGVIDRFQQIAPKVLIAVDGYRYGGKPFDRRSTVRDIQQALPSLVQTVLIPYLDAHAALDDMSATVVWAATQLGEDDLAFAALPFDHPLWVVYSSGTTGLPKPIVQSQGGILLEHLKAIGLQMNLRRGDRFFWYTTTGWMMWNFLVGGLLHGCTILLYDGSPGWPDMDVLWQLVSQQQIGFFGTSAGFIAACMKAGISPDRLDMAALRGIGITGSPLAPEGFAWVYEHVSRDVWLASISGGTDVCTAFVGGCPMLPVRAGEIQCRWLGAAVAAFDEQGQPVENEVGELVLTAPLPSMPVAFWNDPDRQRYHDSYFDVYPGIWRHGDWVKITPSGGLVISGRSDATINRLGVRMGTSEIYRVVEQIPDVLDSVVLDLERPGGEAYMPLFVVLRPGATLDDALKTSIRQSIRTALSPRHVPDEIVQIDEVPKTISGKKLEVPLKRLLMGVPFARAVNAGTVANPHALDVFVRLAEQQ